MKMGEPTEPVHPRTITTKIRLSEQTKMHISVAVSMANPITLAPDFLA
jgi:hypothetical protein